MKKYLLLLCLLLTQLTATAYNFYVDGIYYNNLLSYTVEVTNKTGDDSANSYEGDIVIPREITVGDKTYRVIRIGKSAFANCIDLATISLPNTLSSIAEKAFSGCTFLSEVTIPNSVTSISSEAFSGCTRLSKVIIEDGTNSINVSDETAFGNSSITNVYLGRNLGGGHAFRKNTKLKELTIGGSVTQIGYDDFDGCTHLKSVTIAAGDKPLKFNGNSGATTFKQSPIENVQLGRDLAYDVYSYSPFRNKTTLKSLVIEKGATQLSSEDIVGCTGLYALTIKDSDTPLTLDGFTFPPIDCPLQVVSLGRDIKNKQSASRPFEKITTLTELRIGGNVKQLTSTLSFVGCTNLNTVTIKEGDCPLESFNAQYIFKDVPIKTVNLRRNLVGNTAPFRGVATLSSITIGSEVTSIGDRTFQDCTGLTSVVIPDNVTDVGQMAFSSCKGLTSLTLPSHLTKISSYAFANCSGLARVTIPEDVTLIESHALEGCVGLESLTIPANVTKIAEYAFKGCTSLASLTIPNNVEEIGREAFYGCTGLATVIIEDGETMLSSIGESFNYRVFHGAPIKTAYIGRNFSTSDVSLFYGNKTLTSLTLSDYVTELGNYSFYGCTGLTSLVLPTSLDKIGYRAFYGCDNLVNLRTEKRVPPTCNKSFSPNTEENCVLTIYKTVMDTYRQTEGWSNFQHIEPIPVSATSLSLSADGETTIGTGVHLQLLADLKPADATSTVVWTSSDDAIATVDANGVVEGKSPGVVTIKATANYWVASMDITVTWVEAEKLTIEPSPGPILLLERGKVHLTAEVFPVNTTDKTVIWTSDNTEVAVVFDDGLVQARSKRGSATITATCGEVSESIKILVMVEDPFVIDGITYESSLEMPNCAYVRKGPEDRNVQSVVIPESVQHDGVNYTVAHIDSEAFKDCDWLTSVSLPSTLKRISAGAFSNCKSLTSINIPEGVEIGIGAFSGCENLATVTLPQSLHTIERSVFQNCTALRTIVIPKNVNLIYNFAFYGCTNLHRIYVESLVPPSCELALDMPTPVFFSADTYNNCTLFVPTESVNAYAATHIWQNFSHIQPLPDLSVPMESIEIYHEGLALETGKEIQLTAIALPENASDKSIMWESSDHTVATVSDDGIVTAIGEGEAIITASSLHNPAVNDTCKVTVEQSTGVTSIENDGIKLYTVDQNLVVEGTKDKVEIVTLEGKCVYDGYSRKIELAKGLYIVKVGKHVTKIAI